MEERLFDRDKDDGLTLKPSAEEGEEGGEAVIALPDENGNENYDEEYDEEYDEDLVGLTPSRLQEELAKRKRAAERARAEYERLCLSGEAALAEQNYEEAEICFAQAALYDGAAADGLWKARTRGYTETACFYNEGNAAEFAALPAEEKEKVLSVLGGKLGEERKTYSIEAEPLRERYEGEQSKRREAFGANRRYYLIRFLVCLCSFFAFAAGSGVSASFLVRTQTVLPVVFAALLGAFALAALCATVFFSRKLYLAGKLCRENERASSTEDGARLALLDGYLRCLALVLGEEKSEYVR